MTAYRSDAYHRHHLHSFQEEQKATDSALKNIEQKFLNQVRGSFLRCRSKTDCFLRFKLYSVYTKYIIFRVIQKQVSARKLWRLLGNNS